MKLDEWFLIQDNAPSHRSNHTKAFLLQNNIQTMSHPLNSPDQNLIELVWVFLKKKVERENPQNQEQLRSTIEQQWDSFDQQQIENCIHHFKDRIRKLYDLKGGFY
ncbi:hypothetical protein ABPG72_018819 [Tetrahymena utriculariae]